MSLLEQVQNQLTQASKSVDIGLSPERLEWLLNRLHQPQNIVEKDITITMDDWSKQTFKAFRSQHNNARWPYKWWIRFHKHVSLDEVQSLSIWMSLKTAVAWLPLWGGKWWVIVDPKTLSENELEALSRAYIRAIWEHLWPEKDIPAPDVNTNAQIMAWMADEYGKMTWTWTPGVITWKPVELGGSTWRNIATALGWVFVADEWYNQHDTSLSGKTIVIQWAWNAWLTFAQLAYDQWARIVAISDSHGWIYNKNGLDLNDIATLKASWKSVTNYADGETISQQDLLTTPCDLLVPAALENQITKENAQDIKAKLILELANWPTSHEADSILEKNNIPLLPDILANAWWVTVSYFEQVQNTTNYYRDEEVIFDELEKIMRQATNSIIQTKNTTKTTYRKAAYIDAVKKIMRAMQLRGRK